MLRENYAPATRLLVFGRSFLARVVLVIGLLCLGIGYCPAAYARGNDNLEQVVQDGLVFLRVANPGRSITNTGTGFVVSFEQDILTAKHLFEHPDRRERLASFTVEASLGSPDGPYFQIPMENVSFSESGDFALLKSRTLSRIVPLAPLPLCWDATPGTGDELTALGFRPNYERVKGHIRSQVSDYWFTTLDISRGFSGGPVFSSDGVVVGISMGGLADVATKAPQSGLTAVAPLQNAMAFLRDRVKQLYHGCVRYGAAHFPGKARSSLNLKGTARIRLQNVPALPTPYSLPERQTFGKMRLDPVPMLQVTLEFTSGSLTGLVRDNPLWLVANLCKAGNPPLGPAVGFQLIENAIGPQQLIAPKTPSLQLDEVDMHVGWIHQAELDDAWVCIRLSTPANLQPIWIHSDDAAHKKCTTCFK